MTLVCTVGVETATTNSTG